MRLFLLVCLALVLSSSTVFAKGKPSTIVPYGDVKWEEYAPGSPLKVGKLWGDRAKGAYGMYLKLPAGMEAGMHSHTGDYHAVLLSGTWMHWDDGQTSGKELAVGSYVWQPGKANHNDKCKEGSDCVLMIIQSQKGDFIPMAPGAAHAKK